MNIALDGIVCYALSRFYRDIVSVVEICDRVAKISPILW